MARRILTHRGPNETLAQPVQDIAELRLVPTADVDDRQGVYVEDENKLYFYDSASVLAELSPYVIPPTAGVGNWIQEGYLASGSPSDLYRRKWYQEQVIVPADAKEIPADSELIINELDVQGTLTVNGTLLMYDESAKHSPYSWPNVIPAEIDTVLPVDEQLIVYQAFTVNGKFDVYGTLYLIP